MEAPVVPDYLSITCDYGEIKFRTARKFKNMGFFISA